MNYQELLKAVRQSGFQLSRDGLSINIKAVNNQTQYTMYLDSSYAFYDKSSLTKLLNARFDNTILVDDIQVFDILMNDSLVKEVWVFFRINSLGV